MTRLALQETKHYNKPRERVLLAVHKNIPVEDIPQLTSSNKEYISIKLKSTSTLIIGAAYTPPKTNINQTDFDNIHPHVTGYFFVGGDFNAKRRILEQFKEVF